jgi:DNA-directed RNA polymerase I, II, and III subunit RPABC1
MEKSFRLTLYDKMEDRAIVVLKSMLALRGIVVDTPEIVTPLDDTRMYNFGGILVIFSEKSRISESNLTSYIKFADANGFTSGTIIVSQIPPSETIVNLVREYINDPKNPLLQIFDIRRLQFDVMQHAKVPRHRILKQAEVSLLEKKFNILVPKDQLPWIDSQDAIARWIGARPSDVIEIIRFSESSGATPYYRYCVANVLDT